MFNRESEPARAGRTNHQPIRSLWKGFFGERFAEGLVVDSKIVDADSSLGNSRAAAGLKHKDGSIGVSSRDPSSNRAAAQPFVFKEAKAREVFVPFDLASRVPVQPFCVVDPEWTTGLGIEVPFDDFADPGVQRFTRVGDSSLKLICSRRRHL